MQVSVPPAISRSVHVLGGVAGVSVAGISVAVFESIADRTTNATDSRVIPRVMQYSDRNESNRLLVPLLVLHPMQHLTIFSGVIIRASLMMCSHDGLWRRVASCPSNSTPQ
jgi:hypothetical protein